jgi:hypothetical protein
VHANGQSNGEKMKENKSLVSYWNMDKNGERMHTDQWNSIERIGLA